MQNLSNIAIKKIRKQKNRGKKEKYQKRGSKNKTSSKLDWVKLITSRLYLIKIIEQNNNNSNTKNE